MDAVCSLPAEPTGLVSRDILKHVFCVSVCAQRDVHALYDVTRRRDGSRTKRMVTGIHHVFTVS